MRVLLYAQTNNVTQKSLAKIAQITLMMLRDLILLAKMLARMEENFCTIESHKTVPFICRSNLLRLHYNVPYYFSKIRKKSTILGSYGSEEKKIQKLCLSNICGYNQENTHNHCTIFPKSEQCTKL